MANITNNELGMNKTLTAEDMHQVRGGGLLLPAVQKVREAASTSASRGHEKWSDISSVNFTR